MEVVFVDWVPVERKSDIRSGWHIRRYYAWTGLNKIVSNVVPFRRKDRNINWKAIVKMFQKDSKIWVEYGCGGVAHFFVLLASFIRLKKTLILNVHDFVILYKDSQGDLPFLKKLVTQFFENLLLKRANLLILAAPGLLDWFTPKKNQKVLIMIPGVGEDELFIPSKNDPKSKKIKTAIYFGSMRRKGIIPHIIELFSKLEGWKLLLVGQKEGAKIEERENVRYLGTVSHDKIQSLLNESDVILIPIPRSEYFDKANHIKLGYALLSCKPIIATKLRGISEYISMTGLEENVIYIEEWNLDSLKDALHKAINLEIDAERTIEKLKTMAWESRFREAIKIAMDMNHVNQFEIEWI